MRWLGFDWDEGPEVGGPHAPYRQSERFDVYADVAARLREAGRAYDCYCTTEEVEARREAARAADRPTGYDGHCRDLTAEQTAAFVAEGRTPVRPVPDARRADHLRRPGPRRDHLPRRRTSRTSRSSGPTAHPLYTLVNPVDDALMEITHVLRGEDLLSCTPRQIALYEALVEHRRRRTAAPRVRAPAAT